MKRLFLMIMAILMMVGSAFALQQTNYYDFTGADDEGFITVTSATYTCSYTNDDMRGNGVNNCLAYQEMNFTPPFEIVYKLSRTTETYNWIGFSDTPNLDISDVYYYFSPDIDFDQIGFVVNNTLVSTQAITLNNPSTLNVSVNETLGVTITNELGSSVSWQMPDPNYFKYLYLGTRYVGSQIDDVYVYEVCQESWQPYYTACDVTDNMTLYYLDLNECGTFDNLPLDNSTQEYCNYCDPTWEETSLDCVAGDSERDITYEYTNTCCADTGLPTDCTIPADTTESCIGLHTSSDVPNVVIDFGVEYGRGLISLAGIFALFGIGFFAMRYWNKTR